MSAKIILASASPRRRELLDQIGVNYIIRPVDIDETPLDNEMPELYVQRVAAEKSALALKLNNTDLPVLAADTAVVLDREIMGKPRDQQHALSMLQRLSGQTHQVYSAVSLRGRQHWQVLNITEVMFREISANEMRSYWRTGEPKDKAGAYAIQGIGGIFVLNISGSFSSVIGLPLFETAELLEKAGIRILYDDE
jgi:nucleoside triphosphate pyrophosphatase